MFGRLFGGGSREDQKRLNGIQQQIADTPSDGSKLELDTLASCARELRSVMDSEVSRGARNDKLLVRIEGLSTDVLDRLENLITP